MRSWLIEILFFSLNVEMLLLPVESRANRGSTSFSSSVAQLLETQFPQLGTYASLNVSDFIQGEFISQLVWCENVLIQCIYCHIIHSLIFPMFRYWSFFLLNLTAIWNLKPPPWRVLVESVKRWNGIWWKKSCGPKSRGLRSRNKAWPFVFHVAGKNRLIIEAVKLNGMTERPD